MTAHPSASTPSTAETPQPTTVTPVALVVCECIDQVDAGKLLDRLRSEGLAIVVELRQPCPEFGLVHWWNRWMLAANLNHHLSSDRTHFTRVLIVGHTGCSRFARGGKRGGSDAFDARCHRPGLERIARLLAKTFGRLASTRSLVVSTALLRQNGELQIVTPPTAAA